LDPSNPNYTIKQKSQPIQISWNVSGQKKNNIENLLKSKNWRSAIQKVTFIPDLTTNLLSKENH